MLAAFLILGWVFLFTQLIAHGAAYTTVSAGATYASSPSALRVVLFDGKGGNRTYYIKSSYASTKPSWGSHFNSARQINFSIPTANNTTTGELAPTGTGKITGSIADHANTEPGSKYTSSGTSSSFYMLNIGFNINVPEGYTYDKAPVYDHNTINGNNYAMSAATKVTNNATNLTAGSATIERNFSSVFSTPGTKTVRLINSIVANGLVTFTAGNTGYYRITANTYYFYFKPVTTAITLDPNGGEYGGTPLISNTFDTEEQFCELTGQPTRPGYTFKGWYDAPTGGNMVYTSGGDPNSVPGNGGYWRAVRNDDSYDYYWNYSDSTLTLYAQWELDSLTIKYHGNGGAGEMEEQTLPASSSVTLLENQYENSGYGFMGWNTKKDGSGSLAGSNGEPTLLSDKASLSVSMLTEADLQAAMNDDNTLHLYAIWNDLRREVRFNSNGGEGDMENQTLYLQNEEKIIENQFTKPGYLFKGWSLDKAGSGDIYKDEVAADDIDWPNDKKVVTLYAQWQKGQFVMEDQSVSNSDFIKIQPDSNGRATINTQLSDGQKINIFGLDKGARFLITENGTKAYTPSYDTYKGKEYLDSPSASGEYEQNLSTEAENLIGDTGIMYTNERKPPEGLSLRFSKALRGDGLTASDKERPFLFHYIVTGLDPEYIYEFNNGEEDLELTPNAQGKLTGDVYLQNGEEAIFKNLPSGAKYSITEVFSDGWSTPFDYTPRYDVLEGTVTSKSKTVDPNLAAGLTTNAGGSPTIDGYGAETITDDVTYVFTNTKGSPHSLSLRKTTQKDGTTDSSNTESFTFRVFFSGLTANTTYTANTTGAGFTTDADGKADVTVSLRTGGVVTWNSLDASCIYEIVEQQCAYEATAVAQDGSSNTVRVKGVYGTGASISNTMETEDGDDLGFNSNHNVYFYNNKITKRSLTIGKQIRGGNESDTATSFYYSVSLKGLDPSTSHSYRTYTALQDPNDLTDGTAHSFTSGSNGSATVTFSLKDGEFCIFPSLKAGSTYEITESGRAKWQPAYTLVGDGVISDIEDEDENEESDAEPVTGTVGQVLSTGEHTLEHDSTVNYINTKTMDPPVKTVSDTDGKTIDGNGTENKVESNYVPNLNGEWRYDITQTIDPGYSSFQLYDQMPANVVVDPDSIRMTYQCGNGTTYSTLSKVEEDGDTYYQNAVFRVDTDGNYVEVTTRDGQESKIEAGGSFTIYFGVKVDEDATTESFRDNAQLTPDQKYVKLKNSAETMTDDITMQTNRTETTLPLEGEAGLSVHKNVTGNLGDLTKEFAFTASFSGLEANKTYSFGSPRYANITQVYRNGRITATATLDNKPLEDVRIRVYDRGAEGDLIKERETGEDGTVSFPLEEGSYRYEVTASGDTVEAYVSVQEEEEIDPIMIVKKSQMNSITTGANGLATVNFRLKDDEGVTFIGLPDGARYRITEASSDHQASFAFVTGAGSVAEASKRNNGPYIPLATHEEQIDHTACKNPSVVFTNNKTLNPPTGGKIGGLLYMAVFLVLLQIMLLAWIRGELKNSHVLTEERWWE